LQLASGEANRNHFYEPRLNELHVVEATYSQRRNRAPFGRNKNSVQIPASAPGPFFPQDYNNSKGEQMWTKLNFGKHAGRTLPQVVLLDPNWFFWAVSKQIFNGPLADQAVILANRATHIKISKPNPKNWEVEYRRERDGRFLGFSFVDAEKPSYGGVLRLPYLDLSRVRRGNIHDKRDCRRMIRDVRTLYFSGNNLTKKRCEEFFDKKRNFVKVKG
jgi:hypothetical protein